MSIDRNFLIYGTGILVIVGGCFAIGYTRLPQAPSFVAKVANVTKTSVQETPVAVPAQPPVSEITVEDITDEEVKDTASSSITMPKVQEGDPDTQPSSPDELTISVDSKPSSVDAEKPSVKTSTDVIVEPPPHPVMKVSRRKKDDSQRVRIVSPRPEPATKIDTTPDVPPTDATRVLYRVRIDTVKVSRPAASDLAAELRGKGFMTTIVPYAGGFIVQGGAFAEKSRAEVLLKSLNDNGYDAHIY